MGSLALAAYGAVAGAGAGLTEVGQQAQKEQLLQKQSDIAQAREATLTRLRAAEELKNQQTLQTSSQQFQHGEKQTEYDVMARSAKAHADLMTALKQADIAGRHQDVHDLISGRISVQDLKNRGTANVADIRNNQKPPQSEYKPGKATLDSPGMDVFKRPIPGKQVDVQIHHDGSKWIQGPGGNLFRFDPSQPGGYAQTKGARPSAQDTSALLQNPLGTLPSGVSIRDYFVNKFGSLPPAYLAAANNERTRVNGAQASSTPGANNTSSNNSYNTSEDDQDDRDDNNIALGGNPYGTTGNVPSTSPEDNEPAQ